MIERISRARNQRHEAGFTLIELLVVIIILGILSAVVVFAVRGTGDKGKAASETTDQRTVRTAEEAFCAKNGQYGTMEELVAQQFLSEPSTLTKVVLTSGGPCGTNKSAVGSGYFMGNTNAVVKVAANQDQWPTADSANGVGYRLSTFAYPLNVNVYDPLIIIGSDYTLLPGLATAWDAIPVGTHRATFTSAAQPAPKPLPPGHPTYTNAPDRPYPTTTWRFHLRQGVTFHDGSVMDADDVIWTWRDRQCLNGVGITTSPPGNSSLTTVTNTLGCTKNISSTTPPDAFDSVEKVDQFTVDITPKAENLRLPEQIAHPKGAIVPVDKHFDGSTGGLAAGPYNGNGGASTPQVAGTPVGTGPFKYVSYNQATGGLGTASVERNDQYWGEKPIVKRMDLEFITSGPTRTSKLVAGDVDMAIDLEPTAVTSVKNAGGHVRTASYGQNLLIYVNKVVKYGPNDDPKYELTTDPAVRRAVSLAIDRNAFVANIYAGNAAPGRWMAPPNILGSYQNDVPALAYDPVQARTVLDSAGWTCGGGAAGAGTACGADEYRVKKEGTFAGRQLALRLIGNNISLSQAGYDLLVAEMKDVGIKLTADNLTVTGRTTEYNASRFDLDLELPNQNDANPAFLPTLRFACSRSGTFRFSPVDGVNGIGPSVTDSDNGRYPYGRTPCDPIAGEPSIQNPGTTSVNTTPAVLGPFDTAYVPGADLATTQSGAQFNAAQQMRVLVGQNETNVVIPIVGQFRIYGLRSNMNLGDPHPSQTSQRWVTLAKT